MADLITKELLGKRLRCRAANSQQPGFEGVLTELTPNAEFARFEGSPSWFPVGLMVVEEVLTEPEPVVTAETIDKVDQAAQTHEPQTSEDDGKGPVVVEEAGSKTEEPAGAASSAAAEAAKDGGVV